MTLSQKSQKQLTEINKTISLLFPSLNKLSDYCRAIGFTNAQLNRMSQEQVEKFIDAIDRCITKNNIINRVHRNDEAIAQASSSLDIANGAAKLPSHVSTGSSRIGMGEMLRMNRESQDKMDAAIQDNLTIKSNLREFICERLESSAGRPTD